MITLLLFLSLFLQTPLSETGKHADCQTVIFVCSKAVSDVLEAADATYGTHTFDNTKIIRKTE